MKKLTKRIKALADGTRLKILGLLDDGPRCVCELAALLGFSQPTVTRHLQKLADAGFLHFERDGYFQIYSIQPEDEDAKILLETVLKQLRNEEEIIKLKEEASKLSREELC
ncbi:ArsR family transcriptional regulator [Thermosulfidibacter takaii ABI70S6]|uniref:ArsR family transcriptional regulator n=1 Tax=Thermosulfidibacter takaii (strain DSM 17441 / JCM 13301 / NBRC 103674 / ABI70S6) TaxID=1298851 RepID=A0A0S3QVM1_THET7|nr:metalloregulator ArsR/SmtB family transcription factor [Thermosulfidibacter takaii]BAT72374.1 ArsR family transcriptional regulator [Thermosulfidibacter takaii ABI70S6]